MAQQQPDKNEPPTSHNNPGALSAVWKVFKGADQAFSSLVSFERSFAHVVNDHTNGNPVYDRRMQVQKAIEIMSAEGCDPAVSKRLNQLVATFFYDSKRRLGRPLGESVEGDSRRYPYVKMVKGIPQDQLPDARSVFINLLCGNTKRNIHSKKISGLYYALANILYLSLSRPGPGYPDYNGTSPYLDLSPLYGANDQEEKEIRIVDGRGMLEPDSFFENRQIWLSPTVSALLILFNRNHNYIARRLLAANENGKWSDPPGADLAMTKQDDEIFNDARLMNCIQFKNIIVEDFLKGLLGLHNVGRGANFNPIVKPFDNQHKAAVEFDALYHWSSLMNEKDEEWVTRVFSESGAAAQDPADIRRDTERKAPACPTFKSTGTAKETSSLQRGSDSLFNDADLAEILQNATETEACMPGARSTPSCMERIEVANITLARNRQICTLNEFRELLGLKRFKSFEEWNSNHEIADAAKRLYKTIDNLELYPGLHAEDTMPTSGPCLGYTQTFGLLVDIITSIRNDPRFTLESEMSQWRLDLCNPKPNNGAFGMMLSNLLLRNLPRSYPYDNIYGLFPLTVPEETKKRLQNFPNATTLYDLERPRTITTHTLDDIDDIRPVFNSPETYGTLYEKDLKLLTGGYGYMLGFDDEMLHDVDQDMTLYALMPDTRSFQEYAKYFRETLQKLIKEKSELIKGGEKKVDIIRDVINPTCIRWVCETICGLPVPVGTEKGDIEKYFRQFALFYAFVFRKFDPVDGWATRQEALDESKKLNGHLEKCLHLILYPPSDTGILNTIKRILKEMTAGHALTTTSRTFMERLVKTNDTVGKFRHVVALEKYHTLVAPHSVGDGKQTKTQTEQDIIERKNKFKILRLIANVVGLSVVLSVNYAQACSQAIDFYLNKEYDAERKEIIELVNKPDKPEHNKLIMDYIREAQRIGQPFGLYRIAKKDSTTPSGLNIKEGDLIFADFNLVHNNPANFPAPDKVQVGSKAQRDTYTIQGLGLHKCPGLSFVDNTMPEFFKVIFRLEGLTRHEEGSKGVLRTFNSYLKPMQTDPKIFMDSTGEMTPYPQSLVVQYAKAPEDEAGSTVHDISLARKISDVFATLVIIFTILWRVYLFFQTPQLVTVQTGPVPCYEPTTIFQRWAINTIIPGLDGQPIPIEYTLEHKKAHRLSVIDIDARDMQLEVYVDGVIAGLTTDFHLDKSIDCGEDVKECINQNFSGGVVIVPPGRHSVKIAWAGKEYFPGTKEIDWGDDIGGRRLKTQLESCF